jgi:hypothetical protein
MGDVGMAVQRAQDKTEQLQARAGALDELLASGALQDATVPGGRDEIQSQLDALTAGHDVDDELARMKAQLPASGAPAAGRTSYDAATAVACRPGTVAGCSGRVDARSEDKADPTVSPGMVMAPGAAVSVRGRCRCR